MISDPYQILELTPAASEKEIKSAYRRLCRQYHPDRNPGDQQASERLQQVMDAYRQITSGAAPAVTQPGSESNKQDFFPNLSPEANNPREEEIKISFSQAFTGVQRTVTVRGQALCQSCGGSGAASGQRPRHCQPCQGSGRVQEEGQVITCDHCQGRGFIIDQPCGQCTAGRVDLSERVEIAIPAGVWNGYRQVIKHSGMSLLVVVHVANSPIFQRSFEQPENLQLTVPISYPEAVFGAQVTIPTPEKFVGLKIPAGTPSGKKFKISGQGMPLVDGRDQRGDLLVTVEIAVPQDGLDNKEQRILAELNKIQSGQQLRQKLFQKID